MTDYKEEFIKRMEWSRQQFQSWWITENGNDISDTWNPDKRTYLHELVQAGYRAWKASHAIDLFQIDAQSDKITTLESHNRDLLAANQVMREALQAAQEAIYTYEYTGTKLDSEKHIKAERLCAEALAIQTKGVQNKC